jgi:hypothetical protein
MFGDIYIFNAEHAEGDKIMVSIILIGFFQILVYFTNTRLYAEVYEKEEEDLKLQVLLNLRAYHGLQDEMCNLKSQYILDHLQNKECDTIKYVTFNKY